MKITIESTETLMEIDGVPVREWKGRTEAGVEVLVFVHRLAVAHDADASQFERELRRTAEPKSGGPMAGAKDDTSERVAAALKRSEPLVRDALRLGRSIAGADPSLAGVVIGTGGATCETCGGTKLVRNTHLPRLDDPEWWPCPDCGGRPEVSPS